MVSSSNTDSMQVNGVRLAGEAGQLKRPSARIKTNVPVSPRSLIQPAERLNGDIRHHRQHRRIKFIPVNVSQAQKVKMTYPECICIAQPHGNLSKHLNMVIGPSC